jgi:hypothetical protein
MDGLSEPHKSGKADMASNAVKESAIQPTTRHSVLNSNFPVLLPYDSALFLPEDDFQQLWKTLLVDDEETNNDEPIDAVGQQSPKRRATSNPENNRAQKSAFIESLQRHEAHSRTMEDLQAEKKALTTNADVANISSKNPLVDLFYGMGGGLSAENMNIALKDA